MPGRKSGGVSIHSVAGGWLLMVLTSSCGFGVAIVYSLYSFSRGKPAFFIGTWNSSSHSS